MGEFVGLGAVGVSWSWGGLSDPGDWIRANIIQLVLIFSYNKNAACQSIAKITTLTIAVPTNPDLAPKSRPLHKHPKQNNPMPP